MRFSLIIATLGRVEELQALFRSLASQIFQDFEVIVVDQNSDERLAWTDEAGPYAFRVTRIRSSRHHSSHARNIGLRESAGDIVAFPDDDCIYPGDLLARVDRAFRDQPDLGVLTGPAAAPGGGLSSGRWQKEACEISVDNVWNCAIEFNIFIRRSVATAIGGFDEQLGVGGTFGSAEGNDLVLRALHAGWQGWYDTTQIVVHPDKTLSPIAVKRAFAYGAGLGYALRKHDVPVRIWLKFMIRPLGGCVVNLARGQLMNAEYYWCTLRGRLYGFVAYRGAYKSPRRR
jgi:glycosyltransferase involved in cell wall biosynthesis